MKGEDMSYKRIYILGAGSSIGHSSGSSSGQSDEMLFPTISEYFDKAQKIGLYKNNDFEKLDSYIKEYFGKNIKSNNSKIDIETILTHIEIEIEKNSSPEYLSIRQEVLTFITKLLIKLSQRVSEKKGDYDLFKEDIQRSDTIITFNWDIMLDNKLGREKFLTNSNSHSQDKEFEQKHYQEFVYNLTAKGEGTWGGIMVKEPYSKWDKEEGYFIKAHGSIDWFYCSNEACRAYRKVFIIDKLENEQHCSYCHEQLNNLIIPPVLNKGYRKYPLIRTLWNLASKEISVADEIVIWGYSMPPTDFYASWLLRQARKAPLKKLVIINPELLSKGSSKITLSNTFVRKYYDIFRDQLAKKDLMNSLFLYKNYKGYRLSQVIFKAYGIIDKAERYNRL
jgi:hypothetical protein